MSKSKKMKEFRTEDGKIVTFDQDRFKHVLKEKAENIEWKERKSRGGKDKVFRMIAERLSDSSNENHVESTVSKVKQWYYGNNGPGELEDIYMLADILGYENRETFLKEQGKNREEKMKMGNTEMVNVNVNHGRIISELWSMKEKEAAYELYSTFVDLMGSYVKADMEVWVDYEEGTPEWQAALAKFPRRTTVECAIRKAKMYVSEDTIYKADNLLEMMYGTTSYDGEEPCDYKYDLNYLLSGFREERLSLYREYLECVGQKEEMDKNAYYRDNEKWIEFMMDLNRGWWRMLEDAFEEYISWK